MRRWRVVTHCSFILNNHQFCFRLLQHEIEAYVQILEGYIMTFRALCVMYETAIIISTSLCGS